MDSDSFIPQFWKAQYVSGLKKLVSKIVETTELVLINKGKFIEEFNSIKWVYEGTKEVTQVITGSQEEGGGNVLTLASGPTLPGEEEEELEASLNLTSYSNFAEILAEADTKSKLIIDSNGNSSFLAAPNLSSCWGGKGTVEFGPGTLQSTTVRFYHNLGVEPIVFATPILVEGYDIAFEARPLSGHINAEYVDIQCYSSSAIPGEARLPVGVHVICFS